MMKSFVLILGLVVCLSDVASSKRSKKRKGHKNDENKCFKLDSSDLCSTENEEACRAVVPDYAEICRAHTRSNKPQAKTHAISSQMVSFHDASEPEIIMLTQNMTVAPDDEWEIVCIAEGAPAPHLEVTYPEYAQLYPLNEELNSIEIEKGVRQTSWYQPWAAYEDEGWYRCVARNALGVAYQDTYLTIATKEDICEDMNCLAPDVCFVDDETMEGSCECPRCSVEDYTKDDNFYCGSDCYVYYSKCSLTEEHCNGNDVALYSDGICPIFSQPEYTYTDTELKELYNQGDVVELVCSGVPAGETPGPPPYVEWYREYAPDDRERIGIGNTLTWELNVPARIVCVGVHCNESPLQRNATDIHLFKFMLEEFLTEPPTPTPSTGPPDLTFPPTLGTTEPPKPTDKVSDSASCHVVGDPYVSTFDGMWYKTDGVCTYVLAMDCQMAQWFVYGRFTTCGTASCLESLTVYHGWSVLELQRGWIINNNGEKLAVSPGAPETHYNGMSYSFDGEFITLTFGEGNQLRWNGYNGVQILTPPGGRTCGLCGNNNMRQDDEFLSRWFGRVNDPYTFISSWALAQGRQCFNNVQRVEVTKEAKEMCSKLFFNPYMLKCQDEVSVEDYEIACARAASTNSLEWRAECSVVQSYVLECETRGLNLRRWRQATGCDTTEEVQKFTIAQGCPQENPPV